MTKGFRDFGCYRGFGSDLVKEVWVSLFSYTYLAFVRGFSVKGPTFNLKPATIR